VRLLQPYFRNIGKRLTKSPKLFLRDTGLLHHVLNISSLGELDSHPVRGASWETFVLEDLVRREKLRNPHTQFYFWRTAAGLEADWSSIVGPKGWSLKSRPARVSRFARGSGYEAP